MANDFFIKIDGIDGESSDRAHGKWIEVIGFSHGSTQAIAAGRATDVSGRGHFEPFVFTHLLDKATPKLQQFCMSGQKVAKVQFQVCRAVAGSQVPVYEVTLENVKISKTTVTTISTEGGSSDLFASFSGMDSTYLPVERVEMVASKITWKVTAIKPDNTKDGAVESSFNQVENC
ncbi:MAG: type VI secretion system tube protein Hcp [Succinivibrio sp.]|nr:type VI secretion system tube protein Hcp [Succinivibrio sp.]